MASADEPLVNRNFRVGLRVGGPRGGLHEEIELSFSQVVMPSLRLDDRRPSESERSGRPDGVSPGHLVLRRGHTGSSGLFDLWAAARDGARRQLRDVVVMVLDESFRPVVAWEFTGCRVVALHHSILDALDPGVLTESLEVAFDAVEQVDV